MKLFFSDKSFNNIVYIYIAIIVDVRRQMNVFQKIWDKICPKYIKLDDKKQCTPVIHSIQLSENTQPPWKENKTYPNLALLRC